MMETANTENRTFTMLLDADQASTLLGCHPRTLLRKARSGEVPCFRIFGKVRFTESTLAEWVNGQAYNQDVIRAA